jgi:hypothetical protein
MSPTRTTLLGLRRGGDVLEFAAWRRHGCRARDLDAADFRELVDWLRARLRAAAAALAS